MLKFNKIRALLLLCALIFTIISFNQVVIKPFPFLDVSYTSKNKWDILNPQGRIEYFKNEVYIPPFLRKEINEIINKPQNERIFWATLKTRDIQRNSLGKDIRDHKTILQDLASFRSVCSESSKIFTTLMNLVDIPSRVVWMNNHTVSEIFLNNRWVLMDTWGNVTAVDKTGNGIGVSDIIYDYKSVNFKKIITDESLVPANFLHNSVLNVFDQYLYNLYSNQKLVLSIEPENLFSFHIETKKPLAVLKSVLGLDRSAVGKATQLIINGYYVGNYGLRI